jgi:hypothetical protein
VDADDGAVLAAYELDEALGLEDLALAVAAEVVGDGLDVSSFRPTEAISGSE